MIMFGKTKDILSSLKRKQFSAKWGVGVGACVFTPNMNKTEGNVDYQLVTHLFVEHYS